MVAARRKGRGERQERTERKGVSGGRFETRDKGEERRGEELSGTQRKDRDHVFTDSLAAIFSCVRAAFIALFCWWVHD